MGLETYTISELTFSIVALIGAIGGLLVIVFKSRCLTIDCCWGGASCTRIPPPPDLERSRSDV